MIPEIESQVSHHFSPQQRAESLRIDFGQADLDNSGLISRQQPKRPYEQFIVQIAPGGSQAQARHRLIAMLQAQVIAHHRHCGIPLVISGHGIEQNDDIGH